MTEEEKEKAIRAQEFEDVSKLFVETMQAYKVHPATAAVVFLATACRIMHIANFELHEFIQLCVSEFTNGKGEVRFRDVDRDEVRRVLRTPGRNRIPRA